MSTEQATIFMDHIRQNAARYFEGLKPKQVEVKFEQKQERPSSVLYQFRVGDDVKNHGILVKVPTYRGRLLDEADNVPFVKPDLYPKTNPQETPMLGYMALRSISEYFSSLGENHLGTIRVLDYLPEHQAIFTETSQDPNLRDLFLDASRLRPWVSSPDLELSLQNVGKWLRLYHEMSKEDNVQTRHENRHEYVEAVNLLTDFLSSSLGDKSFFQTVAFELEEIALQILPERMPLGLGHGDFAMRNILVGANGRITVLDTFAKWRTPIYEDIGYFLSALKLAAPQVISQGLVFSPVQLAAYERAFLTGYFEQKPIPCSEIRLYEMLSLLDKWSSIVTHFHRRGGKFRNFGAVKAALTNRYLKISAKRLLIEISK
jgi:hypothetical protein